VTVRTSLMVLGWHNVEGTYCFPARPGRGLERLERQLRVLQAITNIVPLAGALDALREGRPLPDRALAVTFDDGYLDNLTLAGPLLRRLGIPATCFLVPGILSGTVVPWWERLGCAFADAQARKIEWANRSMSLCTPKERRANFASVAEHLKRFDRSTRETAVDDLCTLLEPSGEYRLEDQFLDWEGARELREYMDIGSHTMHHAILARETPEVQHQDLAESRAQLSSKLGDDITLLAYPNGSASDYTPETVAAAERAGYRAAITTQPGWNCATTPPYEIRRWVMRPEWDVVELAKIPRDGVLHLLARGKGR
jgi:peptidoglycan/xylan/chitin deacetylase (PgdA/CDA1 family)